MELKDTGTLLRIKAKAWINRPDREDSDFADMNADMVGGFDRAMAYCVLRSG